MKKGVFLLLIAAVSALGGLLFGYDTGVINGAQFYLTEHFDLSDALKGWVVGSALLGCFVGAVIAGPLSIIGVSFKDVFYQKVTEMYNNKEYLKVKKIFKSSALSLLLIGIPILVVLAIFGEPLFKFIFGSNWGESGKYASILVASFIIKLVVSPLAVIFNVLNKLKTLFMWQTIYFITTFSTLLLSVIVYKVSIITLLKIYLIHELLLYALYFILQYAAIKKLK